MAILILRAMTLRSPLRHRLLLLLIASANSVAFLAASGATPYRLYGPANNTIPAHRWQVSALLSGHLYVSDSIFDLQFDNAFYDGKVQQVWGLGVPLWLVPFELIGRAVGISPFPDRIALFIAFTLFIYYCLSTARLLGEIRISTPIALGTSVLFATAPPMLNLFACGPQSVYEDASLYALITSLSILVACVRYAAMGKRGDFWVGCTLCSLSGLVRPTHAVYGIVGLLLLMAWSAGRLRLAQRAGGIVLGLAGMIALAITNFIRFGSFFEFGHKLTTTTLDGIMTSRFVNPIAQATNWQAARELFGATFLWLGGHKGENSFGDHLFWGQTPFFRWRDFYVSTFDPSVLAIAIAGAYLGIRCFSSTNENANPQTVFLKRLGRSLLFFGLVPFSTIFGFMMHYPGLCARYLYDFTPALLSLIALTWFMIARRHGIPAFALLILWIGFEVYRMDCTSHPTNLASAAEAKTIANRNSLSGVMRLKTAGYYDASNMPSGPLYRELQMGWDPNTKLASYVVAVAIDRPRFVEIMIEDRLQIPGSPGRADSHRARIGASELEQISLERDAHTGKMRVTFRVPNRIVERAGDEFLTLCFISRGDPEDQGSKRILESIRWR